MKTLKHKLKIFFYTFEENIPYKTYLTQTYTLSDKISVASISERNYLT